MRNDSDISKAVDETEECLQDLEIKASLKAEHLLVLKTKVQPAGGPAMSEVLSTTVEETLRDVYLDGYKAAGEGSQDSSNQFIKDVLSHLVATGNLDAILVPIFDKWSHSDAILDVVAHRIASNPMFLKPIMRRELYSAAEAAESDRASDLNERCSPISRCQKTAADTGSDSSDEEG